MCIRDSDWNERRHPMRKREGGVWEIFIPHLGHGARYKYSVKSQLTHHNQLHADPYAFAAEVPPQTASLTTDIRGYEWNDAVSYTHLKVIRTPQSKIAVLANCAGSVRCPASE